MKRFFSRYRISISLLCVGLLISPFDGLQIASAEDTLPEAPPLVSDVALGAGNTLFGSVVTPDNKPCGVVPVVAVQNSRVVTQGLAGPDGRFRLQLPSGGRYLVSTGGPGQVVRAWSAGMAPPGASQGVLLTHASPVERGQSPAGEMFTSTPFLIGALVVAAVAIPVAVNASRKKKSGS